MVAVRECEKKVRKLESGISLGKVGFGRNKR